MTSIFCAALELYTAWMAQEVNKDLQSMLVALPNAESALSYLFQISTTLSAVEGGCFFTAQVLSGKLYNIDTSHTSPQNIN